MSEELGHLFDENQEAINPDKLEDLSNLCLLQKQTEKDIEEAEEKLKTLKQELQTVSREGIPSILNELGLSELKLSTGEKVIVEQKIKSSIANKNYLGAYRGMIALEGGDDLAEEKVESLFKTQTILENSDEKTLQTLLEANISYELKRTIHPQTLNKYCRGLLESGKTIPEEITVFQYQETKIK